MKRIALTIMTVIMCTLLVACSWSNSFEISDISELDWRDGHTTISGTIRNTSNTNYDCVQITFEFTDGTEKWEDTCLAFDLYTNTDSTFILPVDKTYTSFQVVKVEEF